MKYLLIAGSRNFNDRETFERVAADYIDMDARFTTIVEGGASGADSLAKEYAEKYCAGFVEFKANWKKYGRAAGPKRNDEMVAFIKEKNGTALYFWDGESRGTKQCIESARRKGVDVTVWNTTTGEYMDI